MSAVDVLVGSFSKEADFVVSLSEGNGGKCVGFKSSSRKQLVSSSNKTVLM